MFGIWSFLRQFMYTKFIVVVDEDINIRHWADVIRAITTRMDPSREWGRTMQMSADVTARMEPLWQTLSI